MIIEKRKTATYEVLFDLALMRQIKHFFIPRVKAFFALSLLLANLHETERFVKSLSANALKCILLLLNFSFHATQKTKTQNKKILSQNWQNPFAFCFFVDPLPYFAKGGLKGCGENPNSPHVILRRTRLTGNLRI